MLDKFVLCAYNVRMVIIDTTLTTSGNSAAVRLPRELLRTSGLSGGGRVTLEAGKGKIVIRKSLHPRQGWSAQIKTLMKTEKDPIQDFKDMDEAANDGLDELPWDGPSFEDWQKTHGKLS